MCVAPVLFPQGKSIKYDGDALQDYTLIRFLDRFVYKNPKKGKCGNLILLSDLYLFLFLIMIISNLFIQL